MAVVLQDTYLAQCVERGGPMTLLLIGGTQLRGVVKGFDSFTILLECDGKNHLIYKHAVAAIVPP